MNTTIEKITPTLATAYLEKNTRNRPVKRSHVEALAADMAAGRWATTHESIAFDVDDALVDGQHRLLAVVASGATITAPVTRGVARDAFAVIGCGIARTSADVVALMGEGDGRNGVAVLSAAYSGAALKAPTRAVIASLIDTVWWQTTIAVFGAVRASNTRPTAAVTGAFVRAVVCGVLSVDDARAAVARYASRDFHGPSDPIAALHLATFRRPTTGGQRSVHYRKAVRAIRALAACEPCAKLYAAAEDFEVPHDLA